jgi:plasmid rolling circle replication initiator protein Rep
MVTKVFENFLLSANSKNKASNMRFFCPTFKPLIFFKNYAQAIKCNNLSKMWEQAYILLYDKVVFMYLEKKDNTLIQVAIQF